MPININGFSSKYAVLDSSSKHKCGQQLVKLNPDTEQSMVPPGSSAEALIHGDECVCCAISSQRMWNQGRQTSIWIIAMD